MQIAFSYLLFICLLSVSISIKDELDTEVCKRKKNRDSKISIAQSQPKFKCRRGRKETDMKRAIEFMEKTNAIDLKITNELHIAGFDYDTNLTKYNKEIMEKIAIRNLKFYTESEKNATEFDWKSFENKNSTLYRWFLLYTENPVIDKPYFTMFSRDRNEQPSMLEIFINAKVCPYKNKNKENCSLSLFPDVINIMARSRNPAELKSIWQQFRDATSKKYRKQFIDGVKELNEFAVKKGFADYGHKLINEYETEDFLDNLANIIKEIMPLYREFHAFVRRKLIQRYNKENILKEGPIPAHLLGDLYAQSWLGIFDIVNPFPNKTFPNVTKAMLKKKMKPLDMYVMADNFFASMGLERMTPYFWAKSVIEKPRDREMTCTAAAQDFFDGKDFRIRQCTEVDERSLEIVHHEMGHVEYFMLYKHLPKVFRTGANNGFHEAVGEVITLSVKTVDYLKKVSLVEDDFEEDEEFDIMHLFNVAVTYLPMIPYTYIIDHYRNQIYNGSIKADKLNLYWWKLRLDYQGVCPPVTRTEEDFDGGAKYHVASFIEYNRYFFAQVFAFQIHKSLCERMNHTGPLHKCNIYNRTEAGELLKEVLSVGKSKNWKDVMWILTKNTKNLLATPFLEYFQPLADWLKKQNEGEEIGWKSSDPMSCPTGKKKKKKTNRRRSQKVRKNKGAE